jgi:hypothetical protein
MSKETLGITLAVVVGVVGFALWLADKYGKATSTLTVMVLFVMAGLCLCLVYLIPWLWNAETMAEKIWRPSSATALVLIAIGYFGVWVSRPHINEPKEKQPDKSNTETHDTNGPEAKPKTKSQSVSLCGELTKLTNNLSEFHIRMEKLKAGIVVAPGLPQEFEQAQVAQWERVNEQADREYKRDYLNRILVVWRKLESRKLDSWTATRLRSNIAASRYQATVLGINIIRQALERAEAQICAEENGLPAPNLGPEQTVQDQYAPDLLARKSDMDLQFATQAFVAHLLLLNKEYENSMDKVNSDWQEKNGSAKTAEQKTLYGAERQNEREKVYRDWEDRFNRDYLTSASALQRVLVFRLSEFESSARVQKRPAKLPDPPPLLTLGKFAGATPIKQVADYLEQLAREL